METGDQHQQITSQDVVNNNKAEEVAIVADQSNDNGGGTGEAGPSGVDSTGLDTASIHHHLQEIPTFHVDTAATATTPTPALPDQTAHSNDGANNNRSSLSSMPSIIGTPLDPSKMLSPSGQIKKKRAQLKWEGRNITLGTFYPHEADDKRTQALALAKQWRKMVPKPSREFVIQELERMQIRIVATNFLQCLKTKVNDGLTPGGINKDDGSGVVVMKADDAYLRDAQLNGSNSQSLSQGSFFHQCPGLSGKDSESQYLLIKDTFQSSLNDPRDLSEPYNYHPTAIASLKSFPDRENSPSSSNRPYLHREAPNGRLVFRSYHCAKYFQNLNDATTNGDKSQKKNSSLPQSVPDSSDLCENCMKIYGEFKNYEMRLLGSYGDEIKNLNNMLATAQNVLPPPTPASLPYTTPELPHTTYKKQKLSDPNDPKDQAVVDPVTGAKWI